MNDRLYRLLPFLVLSLVLVTWVRTAWVGDDAYITFRTVDNLIHGYGARWNVAERVQAYTHPLWMLLLAASETLTREPYFTALFLSICASLGAGVLVTRFIARSPWQATLALGILLSSRAFIDFSTSGLENALSHLLIACYVVALLKSERVTHRWVPVLFAALILTNRQDLLWLVGPSLAVHLWRVRHAGTIRPLIVGLSPLLAWEFFSLIYYGTLVPNTALAKLSTGLPYSELAPQGLRYLQESWLYDRVTLASIAVSFVVPILWRARPDRFGAFSAALALGQVLYLVYVTSVGGDFMSGRFLTTPLLIAVAQFASVPISLPTVAGVALSLSIPMSVGFLTSSAPFLTDSRFGEGRTFTDFHGIADERLYYYPRTGLLRRSHPLAAPELSDADVAHRMVAAGQTVAMREMVGMFGMAAGPSLHVVDPFALGDPLLARLPATSPWRIGHFHRDLPDGYIQTLRTGDNRIVEPRVAALYADISELTRGRVLSLDRFRAIARVNLGIDSPPLGQRTKID